MTPFTRAYFELAYKARYLEAKADEFQDFFASLMEKCYPGDFQRVRPWGKYGDRKNDGYWRSQRMLFQVYAPNEMRESEAISKIDTDFNEALPYWNEHFNKWTFVHNVYKGLGPGVLNKLLILEKSNPHIKVTAWGFEELRQQVFVMEEADIASLLGPAPSEGNMNSVSYSEVARVVATIARQSPLSEQSIRPVPANKISANALSENVQILLQAGMRRVDVVDDFFKRWHDPRYGDQIAESFRTHYIELRSENSPPDHIFRELLTFAGGIQRQGPDHEAAVLAVVAYFFEQCEIFEAPHTE